VYKNQGEDERPDLMYHTYQSPFTVNTERLGYRVPDHAICMTPNVPRPRSKGRLWLLSNNPDVKPALDFRYFTDEEGYDARTVVDGLKLARDVAAVGPFRTWIKREIAPGPAIMSDDDLSRYGRAAHLIDLMEQDGIVGAADGPKPREVLKRPDWISEIEESMR